VLNARYVDWLMLGQGNTPRELLDVLQAISAPEASLGLLRNRTEAIMANAGG
jgi:hypothetical protein